MYEHTNKMSESENNKWSRESSGLYLNLNLKTKMLKRERKRAEWLGKERYSKYYIYVCTICAYTLVMLCYVMSCDIIGVWEMDTFAALSMCSRKERGNTLIIEYPFQQNMHSSSIFIQRQSHLSPPGTSQSRSVECTILFYGTYILEHKHRIQYNAITSQIFHPISFEIK
jgi:hypothetical protein